MICILVLEVETKLSSNLISPVPFCYTGEIICIVVHHLHHNILLYNYYINDA